MNEKSGLSFHARLTLETPVTNIDRAAKELGTTSTELPNGLLRFTDPPTRLIFRVFTYNICITPKSTKLPFLSKYRSLTTNCFKPAIRRNIVLISSFTTKIGRDFC